MQLTTTKFRIYQVRCTCYLSSILVLSFFPRSDWQFRGDVAILVFLKTMASYNPTSLTPSLFTEVPVLGISNLPISTIFLFNFWNFSDSVIFFFPFYYVVKKELWWSTGNRASKGNIARRNNTALGPEDRLKLLSKLRDSRVLSWLSGPRTDASDEPPLKGPTLYHTRFCKSSSLSFYRYNIMCFVKHLSSKRYC
jgi:hypothetical protein